MINFEKRVREINFKYGSLSGNFVSKKNENRLIQFESSLERDYVYLLEFDPEVYCYLEQPLKIKYVSPQNKRKTYVPDFLVRYRDPLIKDELIEIKFFCEPTIIEIAKLTDCSKNTVQKIKKILNQSLDINA